MTLVVISPEGNDAREHGVLQALFAAGLVRYHVRKPHMTADELAAWVERVPVPFHPRLVLHQHHELIRQFDLGGRHWRDDENASAAPGNPVFGGESDHEAPLSRGKKESAAQTIFTSRSCHDLSTLRRALGRFDSVFYGPVFPSISKAGYGPKDSQVGEAVGALLATRTERERRTRVVALGGITTETAPRALALGFDDVAVLGAIWLSAEPVAAFGLLQRALTEASAAARAGWER